MADLQPPFTISSYPPCNQSVSQGSGQATAPKSRLEHFALSAQPVVRISRFSNKKKSKLTIESDQVIITTPGQGWSIHNVSNQTILSSQKVSPGLVFGAPCVSLSIPESGQNSTTSKSRFRYIYAPIASSSSHTSRAVNEGRTVWYWTEKEVRGGFGERDSKLGPSDSESSLSQVVKEFPSKVELISPLPATPTETDSPSLKAGCLIVLLQTGEVRLCNAHLTTMSVVRIHALRSISDAAELAPRIQLQISSPAGPSDEDCVTLGLELNNSLLRSSAQNMLVYISLLTPSHSKGTEVNDNQQQSNRGKKRKAASAGELTSSNVGPDHYSSLRISVLEIDLNCIRLRGSASFSQDVYDVAIGSQGWITILGCNKTLTSHQVSASPTPVTSKKATLTLVQHPKCHPINMSPCFTVSKDSSPGTSPLPVILPLHPSYPVVLFFVFHPSTSEKYSIGLVLDLRHRAVLHTIDLTSGQRGKADSSQSASISRCPNFFSAALSSTPFSSHAYLSMAYHDRRLVQTMQLPKFSKSGPSWADALDPQVTKATEAWVLLKSNESAKNLDDYRRDGLALINFSQSLPLDSPTSVVSKPKDPTYPDALKEFVERFNSAWRGTLEKSGRWEQATVLAAEQAWTDCVVPHIKISLKPKINKYPNMRTRKNKVKDSSINSNLGLGDGQTSSTKMIEKPQNSDRHFLSCLPRGFVRALLYLCLGQFTGSLVNSEAIISGEGNQTEGNAIYPTKIVYWLLKVGVVEEGMIPGGVLAALCRSRDWKNVELAVVKLVDVEEYQLVQALGYALGYESRGSTEKQANPESVPKEASKLNEFRSKPRTARLLSVVVSQPLSRRSTKRAVKLNLDTKAALVLLAICCEWIKMWTEADLGILTLEQDHGCGPGVIVPGAKSSIKNLPKISDIFEFVQCVLDAHLLGLIQYTPAHPLLRKLESSLETHLETGVALQGLVAPLGHFALAEDKSIREPEMEKSLSKSNKQVEKIEVPVKRPTKVQGISKTLYKMPFKTQGKTGEKGASKSSGKSSSKRKAGHEANLAVGEYALEEFGL